MSGGGLRIWRGRRGEARTKGVVDTGSGRGSVSRSVGWGGGGEIGRGGRVGGGGCDAEGLKDIISRNLRQVGLTVELAMVSLRLI